MVREKDRALSRALVVALVVPVLALAGCGSSSGHKGSRALTVPAYGVYKQTTVPASVASGTRACRVKAGTITRDTLMFLAHVRPHGAYPSDIYYFLMRQHLAGFEAQRCNVKLLGSALGRTLTAKQRRTLLAALPRPTAATLGKGLDRAGF